MCAGSSRRIFAGTQRRGCYPTVAGSSSIAPRDFKAGRLPNGSAFTNSNLASGSDGLQGNILGGPPTYAVPAVLRRDGRQGVGPGRESCTAPQDCAIALDINEVSLGQALNRWQSAPPMAQCRLTVHTWPFANLESFQIH